jgi:hypothetical protein
MIPRARTKDFTEGTQVDTVNTLPVTLLHRVHILLDKGTRSHLVGTHLKVVTLNLVDTRRRMAPTRRVGIPQVDIPINLATHKLVIPVTVHQWLVFMSHHPRPLFCS